MTVEWASQPRSRASWSSARLARGLVVAEIARAISVSSLCRRGLLDPRWLTLTDWMGSMASGEIRWEP